MPVKMTKLPNIVINASVCPKAQISADCDLQQTFFMHTLVLTLPSFYYIWTIPISKKKQIYFENQQISILPTSIYWPWTSPNSKKRKMCQYNTMPLTGSSGVIGSRSMLKVIKADVTPNCLMQGIHPSKEWTLQLAEIYSYRLKIKVCGEIYRQADRQT